MLLHEKKNIFFGNYFYTYTVRIGLLQKRAKKVLAVSMYKLSLFQEDGARACIPIDLLSFESMQSFEKKPLSKEELLAITQTTSGKQLENYVYTDMDHDGSKELIDVYSNNMGLYQTWYCSSDGATCLLVHQNNKGMDACKIELLDLKNETHVVINAYCMMGTEKNYSIISLKDKDISCLASNKYGYVRMTENGDITLDIEAYDGIYEPDFGMNVHTWKDTYLYFDGKTYKEYVAKEIK